MYQISKWTRPLFSFYQKTGESENPFLLYLVWGGKFFYMPWMSDNFIAYLSGSWGWPNSILFRMLNKSVACWQEQTDKLQKLQLFFFVLFNFTILYWFCHISKWIHHRYTCVPHPEPSSLLPPHILPLGRPSAPAPSIQYRASNLDWQLVSYIILYMFQCHSPKSPHPLPLPQSP